MAEITRTQLTDVRSLQLRHEQQSVAQSRTEKGTFADVLESKLKEKSESVKFSKHAQERIDQRGIRVSESLLTDLNQAVQKAKEKGAKDTIVIGPEGAFIVNVTNNVVVTTISQQEMKSNIFTNIDSAVLI